MGCTAQPKGRSKHSEHHGQRSPFTVWSRTIKKILSSTWLTNRHACSLKSGPDSTDILAWKATWVHSPCLLCDGRWGSSAGSEELEHAGLFLLPHANTFFRIHIVVKCRQLCQQHRAEINRLYCVLFCCSENFHLFQLKSRLPEVWRRKSMNVTKDEVESIQDTTFKGW